MSETSRRTAFVVMLAVAPFIFGCVEPWAASLLALGLSAIAAEYAFRCGFSFASLMAASPFFLAILIGSIQAFNAVPSDIPAYGFATTVSRDATLWAIVMWGALAAAAALSRQLIIDQRTVINVFWVISIVASVIAFIGILQALSGTDSLYGIRRIPIGSYTVFGPYYNRNHAGNLFLMALPLAVYALWDATRSGPVGLDGVARTAVLLLPTAIIVCGIVFCGSMASLILAVLGFVAVSVLLWRKKTHLWLLIACFFFLGGLSVYNSKVIVAHHSVSTRLSLWRSSVLMSVDYPLLGTGLGGFEVAFRPYQEATLLGFGDHAHNDWLELACEVGRPAAMAIVLTLAGIAICGILRGREDRSPELAAGIAAMAFMLHAAVDFPIHVPANGAIFAALIGISSNRSFGNGGRMPRAVLPSVCFVAVVLLGFWEMSTRGAANVVLIKSRSENTSDRRVRLERLAYTLDSDGVGPSLRLSSSLVSRAVINGDNSLAVESLIIATRHLNVEPWNAFLILSRAHALRALGRENDSKRAFENYFTLAPWARPAAPVGRTP